MSNGEKRNNPTVFVGLHGGGSYITGVLVVVVGLIFLLDNMGILRLQSIFHLWPLILVAIGLAHLYAHVRYLRHPEEARVLSVKKGGDEKTVVLHPSGGFAWGLFLVLLGVVFQLNELGVTHFHFRGLWPILVILVGVMLIVHEIENRKYREFGGGNPGLSHLSILGGTDQRITDKNFKGTRLMAILGGFNLDLSRADMEGNEAVVDASAILGGGEIRVPENWSVSIQGMAILGAYSDETRHSSPDPTMVPKRLIIRGAVLLGGVNIKN
jgi:cell wall-active antibiotic response 4TMS protein YvqF